MSPGEQKALADIAAHGCHVLHVMAEGEEPPFSYTIGIEKQCGAPEVVVVGLDHHIAHPLLNDYNARSRAGERFQPDVAYAGFLEGYDVQFGPVAPRHYKEYFGWASWLYKGDAFSVLQLFYPTNNRLWPWEASVPPAFRAWQRDLRQ